MCKTLKQTIHFLSTSSVDERLKKIKIKRSSSNYSAHFNTRESRVGLSVCLSRVYTRVILPERATRCRQHICWRQQVRATCWLYLGNIITIYFMSRSTCIPFYPATDGQQTGNNFVADIQVTCSRQQDTCCRTCCPGGNAALCTHVHSDVCNGTAK